MNWRRGRERRGSILVTAIAFAIAVCASSGGWASVASAAPVPAPSASSAAPGVTLAATKCTNPTTSLKVEPGDFDPATAPKPLDACLELTMPVGTSGSWFQVSLSGASFLTMSNVDLPRLPHGRRIKAFFARHPSISRSTIKVAASGRTDGAAIAYAFAVPGVSGRTLLADWVSASRPALAKDMKVASERIGGRTVTTIRATEETTQYAHWALVEALVPVGPVLYVVDGMEGGGTNEPPKRSAEFDVAVSQLPSRTSGGAPVAKRCDAGFPVCHQHGWPFRPPADPALENLIPKTVGVLTYTRFSYTGYEFAAASAHEGIVLISGGERLVPFYQRTGVAMSKITAAYALASVAAASPGTTPVGGMVFAFRVPGVAAPRLLDAWAAVSAGPDASPELAHGADLVLAGRTLRVVYHGFANEFVYAVTGMMFVVVLSWDYTESQTTTFVTDWVRRLPAA